MMRKPHPKEVFTPEPFWKESIWVFSPTFVLRMAIENEEWIAGIVLSVLYFEHFGKEKLKTTFRNKIEPGKIDNLGVETVIMFLFASGIIDQTTYSKMLEINKKRNDIVHRVSKVVKLKPEEAKKLIYKAIDCSIRASSS